jgi:hypothetical protein
MLSHIFRALVYQKRLNLDINCRGSSTWTNVACPRIGYMASMDEENAPRPLQPRAEDGRHPLPRPGLRFAVSDSADDAWQCPAWCALARGVVHELSSHRGSLNVPTRPDEVRVATSARAWSAHASPSSAPTRDQTGEHRQRARSANFSHVRRMPCNLARAVSASPLGRFPARRHFAHTLTVGLNTGCRPCNHGVITSFWSPRQRFSRRPRAVSRLHRSSLGYSPDQFSIAKSLVPQEGYHTRPTQTQ